MSKIEIKPVSRKSNLVTQELEKETLIYDQIIDKAFSLNETSSLIWHLSNGKNSVSDISLNLSEKLNSSINKDFVWLALEQLKKNNLLENSEEITVDFGDLSRREVIRKVGFATLATLPTIAVLVAPTAAQTSSVACRATCRCDTSIMTSCAGTDTAPGNTYTNCSLAGTTCRCRGPFTTIPGITSYKAGTCS